MPLTGPRAEDTDIRMIAGHEKRITRLEQRKSGGGLPHIDVQYILYNAGPFTAASHSQFVATWDSLDVVSDGGTSGPGSGGLGAYSDTDFGADATDTDFPTVVSLKTSGPWLFWVELTASVGTATDGMFLSVESLDHAFYTNAQSATTHKDGVLYASLTGTEWVTSGNLPAEPDLLLFWNGSSDLTDVEAQWTWARLLA